jgi:hypothetical protein
MISNILSILEGRLVMTTDVVLLIPLLIDVKVSGI